MVLPQAAVAKKVAQTPSAAVAAMRLEAYDLRRLQVARPTADLPSAA
jgi:hypothetical protein